VKSAGRALRAFDAAVHALVGQIPRGRVATYGQLAVLLGAPRAARAVGFAMKRCPPRIPWQRVLNSQGGISLRANVGGMVTQRIVLEHEGVPFRRGRVDLARYRWTGPRRRVRLNLPAFQEL
jgi:methylated-DNA-protein-cysteine methyltransferase-like protein